MRPAAAPLMIGSHVDTVINAGTLDGCLGVLAGIEVVQALAGEGVRPARPVAVAAFTNEDGVRFAPNMMGLPVFAGGEMGRLGARYRDAAPFRTDHPTLTH